MTGCTKKQRHTREDAGHDKKSQECHVADVDGIDECVSQSWSFTTILSKTVDVVEPCLTCPQSQAKSGFVPRKRRRGLEEISVWSLHQE